MTEYENQSWTADNADAGDGSAVTKSIKKQIDRILSGFNDGQLSIDWPDGTNSIHGQRSDVVGENATIRVNSLLAFQRLMTHGQIGFAESYMRGEWTTDSLSNLFSLIMRNDASIAPVTSGGKMPRLLNLWRHWSNRNSHRGSKRNIAFHYDLGNDFYRLWLDDSMSYSSAIYRTENDTLEIAQQNKIDQIIEMLNPGAGSRVLEIGCGWGALANNIATQRNAKVTGISLSSEQLQFAQSRYPLTSNNSTVGAASDFKKMDYRDVVGKYDHIVSIEMFEAVGQKYWQTYFDKMSDLLESGGSAVIQTITLLEDRFETYKAKPDFIQRYIFPGGMLPTKTLLKEHIARSGLVVENELWFGQSYADTLSDWRQRFEQVLSEIRLLNFDERFIRMWRYYLVYCETGFNIGRTDVGLVKLRKA